MAKGDTRRWTLALALVGLIHMAAGGNEPATQPWKDRSPHESKFINLRGLRFCYLDWGGKGQPLVFLAGQACTPHLFDELAPRFRGTHRVLGFTRRGAGRSERPVDGYDTKTLAEDVIAFLDAMKIERAVLVGHSLGGTELSWIAAHHPQRVERLIFLDAAYDYTTAPADDGLPDVKTILLEVAAAKGSVEGFRGLLRKYMSEGYWSEAVEAEMREQVEVRPDGSVQVPDVMGWLRTFGALSKGSVQWKPDYANLKHPTLAIYAIPAETDVTRNRLMEWKRKQIDNLRKSGRHVRIVEMKDTPHALFIRPGDLEVVTKEMKEFLALP
ncbi:MAG TPA: alpha/beta hydrolase [Tepidisphaeraceae bacterium]|jgi:pimeloyl-ACP methyl ester carboxylesterase|nr:alpha/beta hydrolase [Tepidisphaeraceae bacterium]